MGPASGTRPGHGMRRIRLRLKPAASFSRRQVPVGAGREEGPMFILQEAPRARPAPSSPSLRTAPAPETAAVHWNCAPVPKRQRPGMAEADFEALIWKAYLSIEQP